MRNFFSFGNAPQVVDLDATDIALILGQNNDAIGDDPSGVRNGVGKSAIIQGIVFGLYGKSIGNEIKIPNLVNKTNSKYCEVTIDFTKEGGKRYRVERGRNPTFFNFFVIDENGNEVDESRGEKKDTQEDLTEILGISQLLFEHIVVLNANVEPFLSMSQQKQREMIEELLGITQLTEKANLLKDMYKETKRLADQEKFKIDTIAESNKRIEQSIERLQQQANTFESNKRQKIADIKSELGEFEGVNFQELIELANIYDVAVKNNEKRNSLQSRLDNLLSRQAEQERQHKKNLESIAKEIDTLNAIDIAAEHAAHQDVADWEQLGVILRAAIAERTSLQYKIDAVTKSKEFMTNSLKQEMDKLQDINDQKCPLCSQELEHAANHAEMKSKAEAEIKSISDSIASIDTMIESHTASIAALDIFEIPRKPATHYSTLVEAMMHSHKLEELIKTSQQEFVNMYDVDVKEAQLELETIHIMEVPETFSLEEVQMLQYQHNTLKTDLEREESSANPFFDQIETLKTNSLQVVSYDEYNDLSKLAEHQDFLTKLLMNKDSFVRKRIIDQNISFLNSRLQYYTEKVGSQQSIEFLNDLSVDISLNGQTYDYKQLSRGERTRVNIALSLAFRDTYESLYQPINIILVDEILDVGLDTSGVLQSWNILKDFAAVRQKNVYVISHREELMSKADNIIKIVKEDGFSSVVFGTFDDMF